jgi:hypothetical protein
MVKVMIGQSFQIAGKCPFFFTKFDRLSPRYLRDITDTCQQPLSGVNERLDDGGLFIGEGF